MRYDLRVGLGLYVAGMLVSWVPPAAAQVLWQSGVSAASGQSRAEVVQTIADAAAGAGDRHLVVQFDEPMTPARRAELAAAGVTLLRYLGDHAFFAAAASDGVDSVALSRVASLADARPIERRWKLHPNVEAGLIPPYAVVARDETGNATAAVYVLFHADVGLAEGMEVAESHAAAVRDKLESINGLVIELPQANIEALADEGAVQWIEWPLPRMSEINNSNRQITEAEVVQAPPYALDGSGVTVLVYDGGYALASHGDFGGRLTVRDSSGLSDHATHVSCTVGGDGAGSSGLYRGMAPGVVIESYGFEYDGTGTFLYSNPGDIETDYDEAINTFGADVSNNSIGSNVEPNGFDCSIQGDYGVTSNLIDTIVRGDGTNPVFSEPFRVVWADGNERQGSRCDVEGFGDYYSTAPPATAKNHVTVGALNSNDDSMTSFSSWGPTDDGRMKPDIAAPGCQSNDDNTVTSCSSSGGYTGKCGTSMASPTVCGLSALLLQDFRAQFPGQPDFRNSTLKALLAHNAQDVFNTGPDYQSGYGSVRIQQTVDFMRTGNFLENEVDQGQTYSVLISVDPGATELKVTLAWDDVPAVPNVVPSLVNDLDLRVFDASSVEYYPWTLDPLNPSAAAVRTQADHLNNIEQVVVEDPAPGVWFVEVQGFNVPDGPQPFSLCASPQLVDCSSRGTIVLDRPLYACAATANVKVIDCDLNTDDGAVETVLVTIASDSEPGGETVLLTETAGETADFRGSIMLNAVDGDGVLQVAEGDTITAVYMDADDGMGGVDVTVTAVAGTDCQPPVISHVQVSGVGAESATVTFDTNESAVGTVRYGTSCGSLAQAASEAFFKTAHAVSLTGLADGTRYFFAIDADDPQGNRATDDRGGECYNFSTPKVYFDFPLDSDPGWTTAGDWAFGQPTGGGSHNRDPSSGFTGSNVYGYNLNGDYPNNLPATYLTSTALDCTGLSDVSLKFRRWLGVESNSNYDEATVEISSNGSDWMVLWRATDLGVDVSDASWKLQEFDVSSIADDRPSVFLRWGMGPTDVGLTYPGWNIDDVQLVAPGGPLTIAFPNGLPQLVDPSGPTTIPVRIIEDDESLVPGSAMVHYRYAGGTFQSAALTSLGGELHEAVLPGASCSHTPEFYFSAASDGGVTVYQPPTAPASVFNAGVGHVVAILNDDFETDQGWTVGAPDDTAVTGVWDRGDPEGTAAQPENDHTVDPGVQCYATDTRAGTSLGTYDVDGGKTTLFSPVFDATQGTVTVSYWRWYSNVTGAAPNTDTFRVDITSNGTSWVNAETLGRSFGGQHSGGWFYHEFVVSDLVVPSATMQVRFVAEDDPSDGQGSLVEAALDDVLITRFECVETAGTCSDGVQNQDEERIDCGGTACPPCECTSDVACDDAVFCDGAEACDPFGECQAGAGFPCAAAEWCDESSDACIEHGNGDFDGSGTVDLGDFADFEVCFGQSAGFSCEPGNMTGQDATIDLDDYSAFEAAITGP